MNTEQLLVGNLAIAAIFIKTILSALKQIFPMNTTIVKVASLVLGVCSAFIINAELIPVADPTALGDVLQKIISGLFIGASAMGIHETTKVKSNNAE